LIKVDCWDWLSKVLWSVRIGADSVEAIGWRELRDLGGQWQMKCLTLVIWSERLLFF